jgi:hypothetical protein
MKGLGPSPFANPRRLDTNSSRGQVVDKFAEFARDNAAVRLGARGIGGRRLWCLCRPEERCHGDILGELHEQEKEDLEAGLPETAQPFPREQLVEEAGIASMARAGRGLPLTTHGKGFELHIDDGAGLCSPGKWRAADRADTTPGLSKDLRQVLEVGVHRWCAAVG